MLDKYVVIVFILMFLFQWGSVFCVQTSWNLAWMSTSPRGHCRGWSTGSMFSGAFVFLL